MRLGALLGPVADAAQHRFLAEQAITFAAEGYTSLWSAQAIGAGSTEQDTAAYGRSFDTRFKDFNTSLAVLREIFANGGYADGQLSPWPEVAGGPPVFFGTWGSGVERAARSFDGWIASGHYRSVDEVNTALQLYRAAGGGRAIVSTIQVGADTDLGELKTKLERFAAAGFDDAVVMLLPGAPSPAVIRKLVS